MSWSVNSYRLRDLKQTLELAFGCKRMGLNVFKPQPVNPKHLFSSYLSPQRLPDPGHFSARLLHAFPKETPGVLQSLTP